MMIEPSFLRLQNTYDGDPTYLVGRHPATAYKWGQILTFEQLKTHFDSMKSNILRTFPTLCIQRTTWTTLPDKSFGILAVDAFAWVNNQFTSDFDVVHPLCRFGEDK